MVAHDAVRRTHRDAAQRVVAVGHASGGDGVAHEGCGIRMIGLRGKRLRLSTAPGFALRRERKATFPASRGMTSLQAQPSSYDRPSPTDCTSLAEPHDCRMEFNVMAGRPVAETLHVKRYEVHADYVRAVFDRSYHSSMLASPSHLIFLTALVHLQKMLYMALCRRWGLDYRADGPELLKIWPTSIEVKIPELVVEEHDLVQEAWVREVREVRNGRHRFVVETRIGSTMMVVSGVTFPL